MWHYQDEVLDEEILKDYVAFVYRITNLTNDRKYIGKKLLTFSRTKKVKGKRKKVKTGSDWKTYYGSNKELIEDVRTFGEQHFKREILKLCKSKGTANYYEMKYQILEEALERKDYYNDQIRVRVHRSHIKG